ncbi:MAG: acyl-CoA dehydrogenase [Desulfobacterales bacterium]|nr:acyl-CoA dehydrogenase [Desulfobacterales bacterium]
MAQIVADRRDIDFVLYEQLNVEKLSNYERFSDYNKKVFNMIIKEARQLAIKEFLPANAEGDRDGVTFENGQVSVPECFHRPYQIFLNGEWTSMVESPEYGGQGLPNVVNTAAFEYLWGANYCLANYGTMGHGTGKMIELFGTSEQKELFLKKLYTGEWGGTMLLTEANAGSDVGALTTTARKNPDGTYTITGNKIFITNGEHDLSENIIHPVLARVEGAPPGTKGISIFIVPKIWVEDDGSFNKPNDVVCTGVEEKLGIHSSATCSMALGGKGECRGLLLGEENQGMLVMFHMMNEARFNVGFQAFTYASSAYLYAANYAKERIQGKDLNAGKDKNAPDVTIVNHPDVRRMLLWMKSHVDGMRSLIYYVSLLFDIKDESKNDEEKQKKQGLIDFFIPIVKGYASQRSFDVCVEAMQVFGGYGYTKEYPIEQLLRDCKITSIYEGTDGIQAIDLMARKLTINGGKLFTYFVEEVNVTIAQANCVDRLSKLSAVLSESLEKLESVVNCLIKTMGSDERKTAFAHAFSFLESTGDVVMAWMLLSRAVVGIEKLESSKKKDTDYYEGIIKTAEFFIYNVLPPAKGKMDTIIYGNSASLEIPESCFGG